ncbi:peroxidase family protein [Methylosinus sp. PW1]|uniref:peroxidase family protein n=1 Tax=Methylosinus sp. PW1 TaxID=107636 RepID=UPI000A524ACD|nr:peroxidase family protein [Methylosinus sp. PW1]
MFERNRIVVAACFVAVKMIATSALAAEPDIDVAFACAEDLAAGLPPIAEDRLNRFLGKGRLSHVRCNGGESAVAKMGEPWVDWQHYWGSGDASSRSSVLDTKLELIDRNKRGLNGSLIDLEYQRMELIRFNLFDNNNTFERYLTGDEVAGRKVDGSALKVWKEMRLPQNHPDYGKLQIDAEGNQICAGELIRFRTLSGACNDIRNPAMGSKGQLFARQVEFEANYPDLGLDEYTKNRHGERLSLFKPDPQIISRKLFSRLQSKPTSCNLGHGDPTADGGNCDYKKAPFFNVLAAFWIQFMTHDWFSHLDEARNDQSRIMTTLGCTSERVNNVEQPVSAARAAELGCRIDDKMEAALVADNSDPERFSYNGASRLKRSYRTTRNNVTAWWDVSQIYGYDERSRGRLRVDPKDPAKFEVLTLAERTGAGDRQGYLPEFRAACDKGANSVGCDSLQPEWAGQESAAFPDNWSLGISFYHNLFVREHNNVVDALRDRAKKAPLKDSGLRNPEKPNDVIPYAKLSDREIFEVARLVVAAEVAKIHTTEWTTQLLYDEPLHVAMNANWSGLFADDLIASNVTKQIVGALGGSAHATEANQFYSALAGGAGIVGLGNSRHWPRFLPTWLTPDLWSLKNPDDVNGGVNHFGSPFNFPEEFVSVYRLHPLLPDLIEYRDLKEANTIQKKVPVIDTFRGKATAAMREGGLTNWALSMGRQRLGVLELQNHPAFLQNVDLPPRLDTKLDVAALDIIRDRERGVTRFNEFRRQIGLRDLKSFDEFVDLSAPDRADQQKIVDALREIYGQHVCNAKKVITAAQRDATGQPINDCHSFPDGSSVDNIEDVDLVVGYLAEMARPHGYAISETQFHVFIINASRRLFSDRFFTSSFRPEFYTTLGIEWVNNNGSTGKQYESFDINGRHHQEISPLKRVLLRAMPELELELRTVANAFDPWARDRGEWYSLQWKARPGAEADEAFK